MIEEMIAFIMAHPFLPDISIGNPVCSGNTGSRFKNSGIQTFWLPLEPRYKKDDARGQIRKNLYLNTATLYYS